MIYQNFDGYGSHLTVLESIRNYIDYKDILEYGGGDYSTKYFKHIPDAAVSTIESQNFEWYQKLLSINANTLWIPDHSEVIKHTIDLLAVKKFDVIFLDTHQDLRYKLASLVRDYCKVTVLHDSETSLYKYHEIPMEGWYWADFILYRPWTSIMTKDFDLMTYVLRQNPGILYSNFADKLYTANI